MRSWYRWTSAQTFTEAIARTRAEITKNHNKPLPHDANGARRIRAHHPRRVELNEYLRRAQKLLTLEDRVDIVSYLAYHPRSGVLLKGTGGIRKLRWRREGMGKSGGIRIVYYYHDEMIPLYILTVFGKGERENLTKAERNDLAKLAKHLLDSARRR